MKIYNILACACAVLAGAGLFACSSDKKAEDNGVRIGSVTSDGSPIFSLKYDSEGKVTEFKDEALKTSFSVSYSPMAIKVVYGDRSGKSRIQVSEYSDVTLNDKNFVSEYTVRHYLLSPDGSEEEFGSGKATVTYDSIGRLQKIVQDGMDYLTLHWDPEGRLLKSEFNTHSITYSSSDIKNESPFWNPVWGGINGLEMTGLFGIPPRYLLSEAVQTLPDGTKTSTARYDYHLLPDGLIDTLTLTEDSLPPRLLKFNYLKTR